MMNISIVILLITLVFANAETIYFEGCKDVSILSDVDCSIQDVWIEPCPTSLVSGKCDIKMLTNVSITISLTTGFDGKLYYNIYRIKGNTETAYLMPTEICGNKSGYELCHYLSGVQVNSTIDWEIPSTLPIGDQYFKIRLWNEFRRECCVAFTLNILPADGQGCR